MALAIPNNTFKRFNLFSSKRIDKNMLKQFRLRPNHLLNSPQSHRYVHYPNMSSQKLKDDLLEYRLSKLLSAHFKTEFEYYIINTVKPVYNDHLMGYFSAFWSSCRWPRAT